MKRILCLALLLGTLAAAAEERPFRLERDFGTLCGTLLVPDGGAEAVALIIAGSGPTVRNGKNPLGSGTDTYRLLAEALHEAGIASLRYDKRAIGSSRLDDPSQLPHLTLDDYVADAAALADRLAAEGFRRVVLVGHSEGALVALLAAQRTAAAAAVVTLAGPGDPMDDILRLQLARQLAPARMDLLLEAEGIIAALERGERVDMNYHARELYALFNPGIQTFWSSVFRYDPRREIRALQCPVLIVGGDNDLQVPADNAAALAAAQPRARQVVIEGMTHTLKHSGSTSLDEQARTVYADPALPLAEGLAEAIAGVIEAL